MTAGETVGAIPGLIALAAAFIGYGKMQQRLREVEDTLKSMNTLPVRIASVETETKGINRRLDGQDRTLERMDQKLDRLVENHNNRRGN